MQTPSTIAKAFRDLDFHDDTFAGIKVLPTQNRNDNEGSVIEIQLLQYSELTQRILRFLGCANLRVAIDFDVLAHNLPMNTSGVDAHTDTTSMWGLMNSQTSDWGVNYPDMPTPLDRKSCVMKEFTCFRVQLCGGMVEIIARNYQLEHVPAKASSK